MKDWIGRTEKVSIQTCNAEIKSLLRSYSQDFELAVYGQRTYELSAEFQHLRVELHRWNSMNQVERREAIDKFWKSKLNKSLVRSQACETHIPEVHQPPFTPSSHSLVEFTQLSLQPTEDRLVTGLSVELNDNMQIPGIIRDHLEEMWKTADKLVATEETIVKAPGFDGCFVQHALDTTVNSTLCHLQAWEFDMQ